MNLLKKDLKYKPRVEQKKALEFIQSEFEKNSDILKYILLDLPVGVGKSYLAMMFINWYINNVNRGAKFDILTNSRILQEQYTDDFKSISNLWGKQNYNCNSYDCSCKEGKEFNSLNKTKCESCPYDSEREGYLKNKINLTNFHMFITMNMYNEELMSQRNNNVLIIDEAHDFESIFSDFITITMSEKMLKNIGFKNWKQIGKNIRSINNVDDFVEFSDKLLEEIDNTMVKLKSELASTNLGEKAVKRDLKLDKLIGGSKALKILKKVSKVDELRTKLKNFLKDYTKRPENWILEYSFDDDKVKKINVQPVWAHPYLDEYVWSKYDHIILMSGTILNKDLFSYINGIPESKSIYYSIDSPFNVKNRPIYFLPLSRMTYKNKENAFKVYKPYLEKIVKKYKNKKGIIHTHTYEIANWIRESKLTDRFIFHESDSKDKALQKHYELVDDPTILVSPSMATGVSLDYDKARFQVMMKVPYPSLGSQKNKMRQKMMPDWYTYKTIGGIIQAYGRAIRSYDDKADFLILDDCFSDIMKYHSHWLPDYFTKAIKKVNLQKAG